MPGQQGLTETRDGCDEIRGRRAKRRPERQQEARCNGERGHAQRFRGRTAVTEVAVQLSPQVTRQAVGGSWVRGFVGAPWGLGILSFVFIKNKFWGSSVQLYVRVAGWVLARVFYLGWKLSASLLRFRRRCCEPLSLLCLCSLYAEEALSACAACTASSGVCNPCVSAASWGFRE
eukprot:COSAG01_NODE_562_length_15456_cov_24.731458_10_plen_175_part_00